jgi:PKD repeat protein
MVKLNGQCDAFPTAGFTYTQTGNTIHFTNTSTDATSYFWNFGDGHTNTNTSPNHTFNGNSNYTVCLIAYHNSCATDTFCETIAMCDVLSPDFSFTFSGLTVSFSDNTPVQRNGNGISETVAPQLPRMLFILMPLTAVTLLTSIPGIPAEALTIQANL